MIECSDTSICTILLRLEEPEVRYVNIFLLNLVIPPCV
jgi:hypothetical protein